MKHNRIEQLIQKSLDRETTEKEEKELNKHLAQCKACQQVYAEMNQAVDSVRMLTEFYPQAGFNTRVLRALGYSKERVLKKIAAILACTWIVSLLALVCSPLPGMIFRETIVSVPALIRLFNRVETVVATFNHTLAPFAKDFINPLYPIIGLVVSILFIIIFNKTLHKEVICKVQ